ncbi:unnamed protein product [Cylicostephanus goldi]|uniref:NUP210 C-terminal Ig-like domain-containing protein n=1 Tax=Cylicostephanus goldi TaxID=71465 RepID=A0A3P7MSQ0_CYLGO|nr:unnamed protein product [Cylicostephanus goldi]
MLYPSHRHPIVSDIVCFNSPLTGIARWESSNGRIEWLDVERGIAKLAHPGPTHVTVKGAEQKLTNSLSIAPAQSLSFAKDLPNVVSNAEGSSYLFPVIIGSNETSSSHEAAAGCTEEQLSALSTIRAPFDCTTAFTCNKMGPAVNILSAKAVFVPKIGSYACVVERQEAGQVHMDIAGANQVDLNIIAKWTGDTQIKNAVASTVFHMAMRVLESEIQLSDMDKKSAVLSIQVPSYQHRSVNANGCPGDIVTVAETRHPSGANNGANKFFLIKASGLCCCKWQ